MSASRISAVLFDLFLLAAVALGVAASCGGDGDEADVDRDETEAAAGDAGEAGGGVAAVHEGVCLDTSDGLLWATANVGAARAEDAGMFLAWAETVGKDEYSWHTYSYAGESENTLTKYCAMSDCGLGGFTDAQELSELVPADDAATASWGSPWRTPSREEWQTLIDECDWTWDKQNGMPGYRVASRRNPGRSIFLPAGGRRTFSSADYPGEMGYYWSRTLDETDPNYAYALHSRSYRSGAVCLPSLRFIGFCVRPVRSAPQQHAAATVCKHS